MTNAQLIALKADIQANTNQLEVTAGTFQTIAAIYAAGNADHNQIIAQWYNLLTALNVYRTDVPVDEVQDQIVYANMTPVDSVPVSPSLAVELYTARAISCQGKQFNLQNLIIGKTKINFGKLRIRNAFQDCLTQIPAGAGGNLIAAGWNNIQNIFFRLGSNAEVALRIVASGGDGTAATPFTMGFEGTVSANDIQASRTAA